MNNKAIIDHYDRLINEGDDPVYDPVILKEYMDQWDGQIFVDTLSLSPDKSVLEIGVGTGRLAVRVCGGCGGFTGIDISPKTIERAKKNLNTFDNVKLICADFLTHDFSSKFDLIYSSLTFMHIRNKQAAIDKIYNLLHGNGRFILSISKNQDTEISYESYVIPLYPDSVNSITAFLKNTGLRLTDQFETEFAYIFSSIKK